MSEGKTPGDAAGTPATPGADAAAAPGALELPLRIQDRIAEVAEHVEKHIDVGRITLENAAATGMAALRMIMEAVEATPGLTSEDKRTIATQAFRRFARVIPDAVPWKDTFVAGVDLFAGSIIETVVKATLGLFDINKDGRVTCAECRATCTRWSPCCGGGAAATMER
jgi:hypothetical protein